MQMNLTQFETLAQLIRSRDPARKAARRVLVDGIACNAAATENDLSPQSVHNTVGRYRKADEKIREAYVLRPKKGAKP